MAHCEENKQLGVACSDGHPLWTSTSMLEQFQFDGRSRVIENITSWWPSGSSTIELNIFCDGIRWYSQMETGSVHLQVWFGDTRDVLPKTSASHFFISSGSAWKGSWLVLSVHLRMLALSSSRYTPDSKFWWHPDRATLFGLRKSDKSSIPIFIESSWNQWR